MASRPRVSKKRAELTASIGINSRRLSTETVLFHSVIAERLGMTATEWKCGDVLARTGPITAGRLAELTGLTTGAITGIVDRMERAGIARRERDPNDRRRVIVTPLNDRAEEIDRLFTSLRTEGEKLTGLYSDEQLAVIADYISRCVDMVSRERLKLRAEGNAASQSPEGASHL